MILKVFSNLNDSMILFFLPSRFFHVSLAALGSSLHTLAILFIFFGRGFRATAKFMYLPVRWL